MIVHVIVKDITVYDVAVEAESPGAGLMYMETGGKGLAEEIVSHRAEFSLRKEEDDAVV